MNNAGTVFETIPFQVYDDSVITAVYLHESRKYRRLVSEIYSITPESLGIEPNTERGLPGEKQYLESGWCHTMLSRYFFTGAIFCRREDVRVAELCSGLGWGAYILSHYAAHVFCLELCAESLAVAARTWPAGNLTWKAGNALAACDVLLPKSFDIVSAMEVIEHFSVSDGLLLLQNVAALLRPGGMFVASSYYPDHQEEAAHVCAKNPHHLHIFTKKELASLSAGMFRKRMFFGSRLFVAVK